MAIQRILIAVDDQPMSLRAAEFGSELGRSLRGETALINVNSSAVEYARAEQESKTLLASLRDRLSLQPSTREFVETGIPAPNCQKGEGVVG